MSVEFDAQCLPVDMVERAARGEMVVIVRDGLPIARLMPAAAESVPEIDEAAERIMAGFRHMREAAVISGLHWKDLSGSSRR